MYKFVPLEDSISPEWRPTSQQYYRFVSQCDEVADDCIHWSNPKNARDTFYFKGEKRSVKTLSYLWIRGELFSHKELKNTCGDNRCINPYHLDSKLVILDELKGLPNGEQNQLHIERDGKRRFTRGEVFQILDYIEKNKDTKISDFCKREDIPENTISRMRNGQTYGTLVSEYRESKRHRIT